MYGEIYDLKKPVKNMNHFGWMFDYVKKNHGLKTCQQNFSAEDHVKGLYDVEGGANWDTYFYCIIKDQIILKLVTFLIGPPFSDC